MLSCVTGQDKYGVAQNLANKMEVEVMAPSEVIWAYPNGRLTISNKNQWLNNGEWNYFKPGAHKE